MKGFNSVKRKYSNYLPAQTIVVSKEGKCVRDELIDPAQSTPVIVTIWIESDPFIDLESKIFSECFLHRLSKLQPVIF